MKNAYKILIGKPEREKREAFQLYWNITVSPCPATRFTCQLHLLHSLSCVPMF